MLQAEHLASSYQRRRSAIEIDLEKFLSCLGRSVTSCLPGDICLYLAWKDNRGKTPVHGLLCPDIADRNPTCSCPRRLAFGTVAGKVSQLKLLFRKRGATESWDKYRSVGNPVDSEEVSIYLGQIRKEQSKARAAPKQAIPLFADKLRLIAMYIDRQLLTTVNRQVLRFIWARDQALLKFMFIYVFWGGQGT
jgi:hypothetical protein